MKNGLKIDFGAGLGFNKSGQPMTEADVRDGLAAIRKNLVERFGAYTETRVEGGWRNSAGVLVVEPGVNFSVTSGVNLNLSDYEIELVACHMKGALNQEAIFVSVTPVRFELV